MQANIYLEGHVYHMVHFKNLESILRRRALLSKNKINSEETKYHSIANEDVQDLRDRVYLWDALLKRAQSLHYYVPFYFAKQTPMLYYIMSQNGWQQHDIVFVEVSRLIINDPGVVFTSGNATIQMLAKYGTERVFIVPATIERPFCKRRYSPSGPHGANNTCSDIYGDSIFLENLDWTLINNDRWGGDPEKKRIKHAEVLVPNAVPLSKIKGISTLTQARANEVNELIKRCGLNGRIPGAVSKAELYF